MIYVYPERKEIVEKAMELRKPITCIASIKIKSKYDIVFQSNITHLVVHSCTLPQGMWCVRAQSLCRPGISCPSLEKSSITPWINYMQQTINKIYELTVEFFEWLYDEDDTDEGGETLLCKSEIEIRFSCRYASFLFSNLKVDIRQQKFKHVKKLNKNMMLNS